jgi:hypothetical protein
MMNVPPHLVKSLFFFFSLVLFSLVFVAFLYVSFSSLQLHVETILGDENNPSCRTYAQ